MQRLKWLAGREDKADDFNSVACFLTLDLENVLLSGLQEYFQYLGNIWLGLENKTTYI